MDLYWAPDMVWEKLQCGVAERHALKATFGDFPIILKGWMHRDTLMAMHHAYNAARSQHERDTIFKYLSEKADKYRSIQIVERNIAMEEMK